MPQADTDNTRFREHICKFSEIHALHFRDGWIQFTVIDGDLWFRDWDVVKALGCSSPAYIERLLNLVHPNETIVVLTDRGPYREEREIGGFIASAGSRRMAEAVRSRPRRERFIAWLNTNNPQRSLEERHGPAGAEEAGSTAAARGHSVMSLSRRSGDRAPARRTEARSILAGNSRGA